MTAALTETTETWSKVAALIETTETWSKVSLRCKILHFLDNENYVPHFISKKVALLYLPVIEKRFRMARLWNL